MGKLIFGGTSKESIIEISQGQLYLVRPSSPKSYSELIFKDAAARIQRTNQEYQYQLVIQRVYEEGEADLGEDGDSPDIDIAAHSAEHDEKAFFLDKSLRFRSQVRPSGEKVLAWRDLRGDNGDIYQFVCDSSVDASEVIQFESAAQRCQYEITYRKNYSTASKKDLAQFCFDTDLTIPSASPTQTPKVLSAANSPVTGRRFVDSSFTEVPEQVESPKNNKTAQLTMNQSDVMEAPKANNHPKAKNILCRESAELHLFDFHSGSFILQQTNVDAIVSEVGNWEYWLEISTEDHDWVGQEIIADINPVFNFEYLSFIFNAYSENGDAYSWLLRFQDEETLTKFQQGLMQALWEQLNQLRWKGSNENDRDYVLGAFRDMSLNEEIEEEDEEAEIEKFDEGEEIESDVDEDGDDSSQQSEHYDTDEDEDDIENKQNDGNVNSLLAVGYKNDRSFVVRGSKIGVFKHTPNNHLEFSTNIARVETPNGKLFSPKKVMLHEEDSNLILQNDSDPNSLYRMDLEYGKVVEEWKIHPDIKVETFAPEKKFSQMTGEKTFIGLSRNALFRIDPRLAGNKLVDSELKQYVSKNDFSAAATTEKGFIAVASNKGDIRMFDRLGINAKTHIPALGEPIIGLDVSADGRWILATCRTYLLLIDTLQKQGPNEGRLGFEKSFSKGNKPQPRRLGLTPAHVAQFQHETGSPLSFTTARFNAGEGLEETSIISATGPFVVTWSMKKVLLGIKEPYSIKRYAEEVKADNFRYGSDRNVIVTLPNEVNMVAKAAMKKPTRESIGIPSQVTSSRFSSRSDAGRLGTRESSRYKLGKDDVVNSPY